MFCTSGSLNPVGTYFGFSSCITFCFILFPLKRAHKNIYQYVLATFIAFFLFFFFVLFIFIWLDTPEYRIPATHLWYSNDNKALERASKCSSILNVSLFIYFGYYGVWSLCRLALESNSCKSTRTPTKRVERLNKIIQLVMINPRHTYTT